MKRRVFAQRMGLVAITFPLSSVLVACGGGGDAGDGMDATATSGGVDTHYAVSRQADTRMLVDGAGRVYAINPSEATLTQQVGPTPGAQRRVGDHTAHPVHASFDASGNAYVLDKVQGEVRVYAPGGDLLLRFGKGGAAALSQPSALAVRGDRVYVADSGNHRVQVFSLVGTPLASFGTLDPLNPVFNYPNDLQFDADGYLHVLQSISSMVTVHDAKGTLVRQISLKFDANGERRNVRAIALGPDGRLYCADARSGSVLTVDAGGSLLSQHALTDALGKRVAARYLAVGLDSTLYVSGVMALA